MRKAPAAPDAIILCGGAGLRLRSITADAPKSMASVAGRPFLELLLKQLRRSGFERVILAVGYQRDVIRAHFGSDAFGLQVAYSEESTPLGTGGALRNAAGLIESGNVLIMNGDSYTDINLATLLDEHRNTGAEATVVVVPVDGRSDMGNVQVGVGGRLERFDEKTEGAAAGFNNAGIYMMTQGLVNDIPAGTQISLERELFPRWIKAGRDVRAMVSNGGCMDIGTPERYRRAQGVLQNAEIEEPVEERKDCR